MSDHVELHLNIIGNYLEHAELYRDRRLEGVKHLVWTTVAEIGQEQVSIGEIKNALCVNHVQLVKAPVIREALRALVTDGKLSDTAGHEPYGLLVTPTRKESGIGHLVNSAWERHFVGVPETDRDRFRTTLSTLFAKYGCAAYDTLSSSNGESPRIDQVLPQPKADASSAEKSFVASFHDFVRSRHPKDAELKAHLAAAYTLLRMNGAGNWQLDELAVFFAKRRFLLDTNVLFESAGTKFVQLSLFFSAVMKLGGTVILGSETRKEFETALRGRAAAVQALATKGVDLKRLRGEELVRGAWIDGLIGGLPNLDRDSVLQRVDELLASLDEVMRAQNVAVVHLDHGGDAATRAERVQQLKDISFEARGWEKADAVALHDALLWGAIEDQPAIADVVLSLDRSLTRMKTTAGRLAISFDDVIAYALLGNPDVVEIADLFNSALIDNIVPSSEFLSIDDIQTVANMESGLLTAPENQLRRAAAKIADLKRNKALQGGAATDGDIARVVLNVVTAAPKETRALTEEREKNQALVAKLVEVEGALEKSSRQAEESARAASRVSRLEEQMLELRGQLAEAKTSGAETARLRQETLKERDESKDHKGRQKSWFVVVGIGLALALVAFTFGAVVTTCGVLVGLLLVAAWIGLTDEPPKPVIGGLTAALALLTSVGTIAEKRKAIGEFFSGPAQVEAASPKGGVVQSSATTTSVTSVTPDAGVFDSHPTNGAVPAMFKPNSDKVP